MATAVSADYADVLTAYNATSPGGTLVIPADDSAAWSSTLTISKAITIQGAGLASTIINPSGAQNIFKIDLSADVPVRITGINIPFVAASGYGVWIAGKNDNSLKYSQIRLDNNKFEKGARCVFASGWVEGVIHSNQFLNCDIGVGINGDDNYAWDRTIAAGTANALFIEDNTFTFDNNADADGDAQIYHQQGGRTVVRYNTFDGDAYTDGNFFFFDSHGNQDLYDGSDDFRGQPILEVYDNDITCYQSYGITSIRGGSLLFYNNDMVTLTGVVPAIRLTEEESWQTLMFDPLDDTWPAEDQINNSFFWNNTSNTVSITDVTLIDALDSEFIQKDRDYFMHAPESSGGSESYTNRQGAAGNGADGTLVFSGSGANKYYPYSPYTYLHPLRTAGRLVGVLRS